MAGLRSYGIGSNLLAQTFTIGFRMPLFFSGQLVRTIFPKEELQPCRTQPENWSMGAAFLEHRPQPVSGVAGST
eukprot:s4915_g8.t1